MEKTERLTLPDIDEDIDEGSFFAVALSLDTKGRAVLAGQMLVTTNAIPINQAVLVRLDPLTLELDKTFDNEGIVVRPGSSTTGSVFGDLELDTQDRIISAGSQESDFLVARFLADGKPDTNFGDNGQTLVDSGAGDKANTLALDADGKIIAAGFARDASNTNNFALARLNP